MISQHSRVVGVLDLLSRDHNYPTYMPLAIASQIATPPYRFCMLLSSQVITPGSSAGYSRFIRRATLIYSRPSLQLL